MAFGSWIKNIAKKVASGFKKALPIIQTIGNIASNVIAPGLIKAGGILGGNAGKRMIGFGETLEDISNKVNHVTGRVNNMKYTPELFGTPMMRG